MVIIYNHTIVKSESGKKKFPTKELHKNIQTTKSLENIIGCLIK